MQKIRTFFTFGVSLATALLCVGAVVFFLHVIKNKNEHSSNALSVLQQKIAQKDDSTVIKKKVTEVVSLHDSIASHVVSVAAINTFVDYLEAFGTSTNTTASVRDIKLNPKDKNSILGTLTITGAFPDVEKAIGLLENDRYQMHITSLSLVKDTPTQSQGTTNQLPTWHADISFNVLSS